VDGGGQRGGERLGEGGVTRLYRSARPVSRLERQKSGGKRGNGSAGQRGRKTRWAKGFRQGTRCRDEETSATCPRDSLAVVHEGGLDRSRMKDASAAAQKDAGRRSQTRCDSGARATRGGITWRIDQHHVGSVFNRAAEHLTKAAELYGKLVKKESRGDMENDLVRVRA